MRLRIPLGFALCLVTATASAQAAKPLAATLTGDAKAAYDAGKLLFGDGDFAGAEIKFEAAYDGSHDARLLWNMAACEKSQRHYARTEQLVQRYLGEGGALLTAQDRADAKALLELIDSFTVKLTVTVNEPGAEVSVDGVAVGTTPLAKPVVVDIGTRTVVVHKEGFKPFERQLPVGGNAAASLDVKLVPQVHEGRVSIVTAPTAAIFLDDVRVGVGRYEGKVKSGGHTLRVVAAGMRPYQSEIVISDDEARSIDVPLEPEERAVVIKTMKAPWAPSGEAALSLAPGVKMHNGGAAVFDLRAEIGWKPGWPTELALTVDLGSIDASGNCALDVGTPGPLDPQFQMQSCLYVKPGLEFAVHFLPKRRFDPYVAIDAGFRFTFVQYNYYDPLGLPKPAQFGDTSFLPGIDTGGRVGIDYTPLATSNRWRVGAYVTFLYVVDDESNRNNNVGPSVSSGNNGPSTYPWLLAGIRTSLLF